MGFYFHFRQAGVRPNSLRNFTNPVQFSTFLTLDNQLHQLQLVATGKMQFLAVAVQFLTDFLFWQPVAVAVGPNMVKKPDPTGLSNTITVAELKQLVSKPEVVKWTDVSAADPRLLLHLKCYRNTIPIPAHWSAKRDYLQGKHGIEKPPIQLPSYIANTGIATQRNAIKEKEANMSLKAKTCECVQPKMGKIDIDYQKLHDAFFKFQTKPPLMGFGEMYYEGKEFETSLKEKRPGDLSPELVEALSIPPLAPPPWLISMQCFGPPPSYPTLRIPGLNVPILEG
jgi:splicing factor 3B subunit 2